MSGIEIGLSVVFGVICIVFWIMYITIQDIKYQNKVIIDKMIPHVSNNIETLLKAVGGRGLLTISADGTEYFCINSTNEVSVHERINLLMDHLKLEIKEGEPSKAVLVKKTAKKGK